LSRTLRKNKPKVYEKDVLKQVIQYLKLKKLKVFRMNSGSFPLIRKDGSSGFARGHEKGTADVLAFTPTGSTLWVEVKSPTGKVSPEQAAFGKEMEHMGHIYIVARSIEDLQVLFGGR
jgi:hypothetical protein